MGQMLESIAMSDSNQPIENRTGRLSKEVYAEQLARARAEMPTSSGAAKMRWRRAQKSNGIFTGRVVDHAFFGRDVSWWKDIPVPEPEGDYLQNIQDGWMWARIEENSRRNYITSSYALNLADPEAGLGSADWHQMCWWVPIKGIHPRARDCLSAIEVSPFRGDHKAYFSETWAALGDRGVIDVRPGLNKLGHPAGKRTKPVWGANHVRAIIDQAWHTLRVGVLPIGMHVTPALVARWLWSDEQFDELKEMSLVIEQRLASGDGTEAWGDGRQALSPEATWEDTPQRDGNVRQDIEGNAPAA